MNYNNTRFYKILKNFLVITRPQEQSGDEFESLKNYALELIYFPTIKIELLDITDQEKELLRNKKYDYLIFTSVNAVKYFVISLRNNKINFDFNNTLIIAVGSKTKVESDKLNLKVDIVPDTFSGEGIINLLENIEIKNKKFLLPVSELASDELYNYLISKDAFADRIKIYSNSIPYYDDEDKNYKLLKNYKPEYIVFTSPSTYNNYCSLLKIDNFSDYFNDIKIAVIGDVTAKHLEENSIKISFKPEKFTVKNMINEIIEYIKEQNESNKK